ncbi:hypothetical protein HY497_01775 [Candidatus Woesearchaeota archaeon]|nr:hypothetical protein [Candidatus Woesearchaeota archaeon]
MSETEETKQTADVHIERAVEDDSPEEQQKSSDKLFYIILATILIIFISIIAFRQLTTPTGALTFEEMHELNLNGKLSPDKGYIYNGFSFVFFDSLWYTKVTVGQNDFQVPLHFGPRDVEGLNVSGSLSPDFNRGSEIYVVVNPISSDQDYIALAASELAQNLAIAIKRRPVGACDRNETTMCEDRPIVTCETTDKAMVYLESEPGPAIEFKDRCIIARGLGLDLVKAVDNLILQWYGVV